MSKTITIPENHKPFIVNINNREYIYRGGETVEVPDELVEGSLKEITTKDLEGITTIYNCAFYGSNSITKVTIPKEVTYIGGSAFNWCVKLVSVFLPETPPTLANVDAFSNINANCVFYCKTQESFDAYKTAPNWSTLTGTYSFVVKA